MLLRDHHRKQYFPKLPQWREQELKWAEDFNSIKHFAEQEEFESNFIFLWNQVDVEEWCGYPRIFCCWEYLISEDTKCFLFTTFVLVLLRQASSPCCQQCCAWQVRHHITLQILSPFLVNRSLLFLSERGAGHDLLKPPWSKQWC